MRNTEARRSPITSLIAAAAAAAAAESAVYRLQVRAAAQRYRTSKHTPRRITL